MFISIIIFHPKLSGHKRDNARDSTLAGHRTGGYLGRQVRGEPIRELPAPLRPHLWNHCEQNFKQACGELTLI